MTPLGAGAEGDGRWPELVVFDCDGVLVDSERLAVAVDVVVLERVGWPMSDEEIIERFVGRSHEFMVAEIEAHLGGALRTGWELEFAPLYEEAFRRELRPVPGVVEVIRELVAAGVTTCVASSGSHEKMRATLGMTGLYDTFAGRIFSASEVAHGKPAPDLFLHAAASMKVAPQRCAVIEDSTYGVAAARAAEMAVYAFAGGVTPADRLAGPGTVVFHEMTDLVALLAPTGACAETRSR